MLFTETMEFLLYNKLFTLSNDIFSQLNTMCFAQFLFLIICFFLLYTQTFIATKICCWELLIFINMYPLLLFNSDWKRATPGYINKIFTKLLSFGTTLCMTTLLNVYLNIFGIFQGAKGIGQYLGFLIIILQKIINQTEFTWGCLGLANH